MKISVALFVSILGAALFLIVPFANNFANANLPIEKDGLLPFVYAGAGLLYSLAHILFVKGRRRQNEQSR